MRPAEPANLWLAVLVCSLTLAAQVGLMWRMAVTSSNTREALRHLPLIYLVSALGAVVAVFAMYDAAAALQTLEVSAVAGAVLLLALRFGLVPEAEAGVEVGADPGGAGSSE